MHVWEIWCACVGEEEGGSGDDAWEGEGSSGGDGVWGRWWCVGVVMVCGGGGGVWWDHPQLAQLQGANTREFVHPDTSQCM